MCTIAVHGECCLLLWFVLQQRVLTDIIDGLEKNMYFMAAIYVRFKVGCRTNTSVR